MRARPANTPQPFQRLIAPTEKVRGTRESTARSMLRRTGGKHSEIAGWPARHADGPATGFRCLSEGFARLGLCRAKLECLLESASGTARLSPHTMIVTDGYHFDKS